MKGSRQMHTTYADTNDCIVGPDGLTREHVVLIKWHEDVDLQRLESGAFLPIAHVGYTAQVSTCSLAYTYWN